MAEMYYCRGFADKTTEAVLVCFANGMRIVNGTTEIFWDRIFTGKVEVPFVLETSAGDMAVGGVTEESHDLIKKYIVAQVMSRVKRNHEKGQQSSVVPVFSGVVPNSFLTVSAIEPITELKDDLEDYAQLEVFLHDWIKGFPGMFV